jgi:predicted metal-dependent enzyme (double-stranded beta helix superfamily)
MAHADLRPSIDRLVAETKSVFAGRSPDAVMLRGILGKLESLASKRHFWSSGDFPPPDDQERQARYLIREDPDHTYALYLNVMRPGRRIPPHNHTTWACIAAVEGCEHNYLYERLDDGSVPGHARIRETATARVEPGQGIVLLPDDIHSVEIKGEQIVRHVHFYGRALDSIENRLSFDPVAETCKAMTFTVPTRRVNL